MSKVNFSTEKINYSLPISHIPRKIRGISIKCGITMVNTKVCFQRRHARWCYTWSITSSKAFISFQAATSTSNYRTRNLHPTKKCCFVKAELLAEHHMYDMNMETLHIVRHKSGGQAEAKSLWGVEWTPSDWTPENTGQIHARFGWDFVWQVHRSITQNWHDIYIYAYLYVHYT